MATCLRYEGCLVSVALSYRNVVVAGSEVQCTEPGRALQSVQTVINERQWIVVTYGDSVELPVVNAES